MFAQTQFDLSTCFYSWKEDAVAIVIIDHDPGSTQYIHIMGDSIRPSINKTSIDITNFIDKDGGALGQTTTSRNTNLRENDYEVVWEGVVLQNTPLSNNILDISKVRVGIKYLKLEIRPKR